MVSTALSPLPWTPDFAEFRAAITRSRRPSRPVVFEFFLNENIDKEVIPADQHHLFDDYTKPLAWLTRVSLGQIHLGFDAIIAGSCAWSIDKGKRDHGASVSQNQGAMIPNREAFNRYHWNEPEDADGKDHLDTLGVHLRGGQRFVIMSPFGGVLETLTDLCGFDDMCMLLADDPELIGEITDNIGSRLLRYYTKALEHPLVGGIMVNDDWGFRSATMISPKQMRKYVVPWHQRFVAAAHAAGKIAVMHSCGNLGPMWNDIIDVIKFDGKHSYEDAILPVEDAYERYGSKVGIMGGIDVDYLCRHSPEQIHERATALLNRTKERGGYVLGSGNSIPYYVPTDRFAAMFNAARSFAG